MRAWLVACGLVVSACGVGSAVAACGSVSCEDNKNCATSDGGSGMDATVDGSVIEGGGMDTAPPGCDAGMDPKDSPACVDDSFGIFVSPTGSDGAAGTKMAPLLTITAALGKTSAAKNRVYVCEGTYAEAVTLGAAVNLYGGFDCGTWSYATKSVKVAPSAAGVALTVTASGVTVEDIEFDAKDGVNPGDSSIAVFVSGAQNVLFRRVTAMSGAGQDGANPAATSNYDGGTAPPGNTAPDANGGAAKNCAPTCANSVGSIGGKGGDTNAVGQDGGPPLPENPLSLIPPHDGMGGGLCGVTFPHPGADAPSASGGASGALKPGSLGASAWTRANGLPGALGGPGEGGGGGGGGTTMPAVAGGGGGGCGGCGGAGGSGGMSGGSSFALLSFKATVTLDACTLKTAKAGNGKSGGGGQAGQTGGFPGNPAQVGVGCAGATGGSGGAGAGGGGGAGGHSVAIGYVDTAPTEQGTVTKTTAAAGTGGAGGGGGSPPATAGTAGSNAQTLAL